MNPRKPPHLKAIAGTERADRAVIAEKPQALDFPLVEDVPEAPDWLPNTHAVKEWNRLAPLLTERKLLTAVSLSSLGMLCSLHGKIVQLYAAGEAPGASMVGALRNMQNDFGLTPASQGKVKATAPSATPEAPASNSFARNGVKHRRA